MTVQPEIILKQYDLGKVEQITPIDIGLIHSTYLVEARSGDYILQCLHDLLSSEDIGNDFIAITKHLEKNGFYAAQAITNKKKNLLTKDLDGKVWRIQTKLPGQTHDVVKSKKMAYNAGSILARLHKTLNDIEYKFKSKLILHDTESEYKKMHEAKEKQLDLLQYVKKEFDLISEELPKHYLPKNIPIRVIHGDPKISNILFDGFENAISVIDLDTCNHSSVLNDIGDAMRSWCGGKEDDSNNKFNKDIYDAAMNGYLNQSKDFLNAKEIQLIPQAVGKITLELAARFLADYFNDSYFGWDEKKYKNRRAHNLARCRGQIAQYKDFKEKMGT